MCVASNERPQREPRESREPRHTPQFLQRPTSTGAATAQRVEVEVEDEFEED